MGDARPQPALLVEPVVYPGAEEEKTIVMSTNWEVVEQTIRRAPEAGKLDRDLIILADAGKLLLRARENHAI